MSDGQTEVSQDILFSVTPINDAPTASVIEQSIGEDDAPLSVDLLQTADDVDGDVLSVTNVTVLASTDSWLRYKLPRRLMRRSEPRCIGQKQIWYLLHLDADEDSFDLGASVTPEFDHWKWVDYWYPADNVVFFKRRVYQCALAQLESKLPRTESA